MVSLKDIVDCYIPREGVTVTTTKCPKYGSWTVEIRNEHGLCFRKSDYEPDWQYDLEQALAYWCYTISQAMEAVRGEVAQEYRNLAGRQKDSQRIITKRIIGCWLHKRGIPVLPPYQGWYTIDAGHIVLKLSVDDKGHISVRRFYTGLAGIETASGLNGLISFVNELEAQ